MAATRLAGRPGPATSASVSVDRPRAGCPGQPPGGSTTRSADALELERPARTPEGGQPAGRRPGRSASGGDSRHERSARPGSQLVLGMAAGAEPGPAAACPARRAPAWPATVPTMARTPARCVTSVQPVADAPHRGEGKGVAELLAQLADVHVDGALVAVPVVAPHAVEELAAAEGDAAVARPGRPAGRTRGRRGRRPAVDRASRRARSTSTRADRRSRAAGRAGTSARRRIARTRATSSRGENGLVT